MTKQKICKAPINKPKFKSCGTVTCIHNINNKCMQRTCELHERSFRQEY